VNIFDPKSFDEAKEKHEVFVRLTTSFWSDKNGLHTKKSLRYLRRRCEGHNFLEEDASNVGSDEVIGRIINLFELKDGVYKVVTCNEKRDWETGLIDDYDYKLLSVDNKKTT
jgi:hypothetical protein